MPLWLGEARTVWPETGTIKFSIFEPIEDALHLIRVALEDRGLRILFELDLSRRIERTLGIHLPPCRILYIWPQPAVVSDLCPDAAVVLPFHMVVASRGRQTDICVQSRIRHEAEDGCDAFLSALMVTQAEILGLLETL